MRWKLVCLAVLVGGCRAKPPFEGKSVAELEAMVRSAETPRQVQGAFGLSRLGPEAAPAVPALREAMHSPAPAVRQNTALALGKIGSADAVPELTAALRDPEWLVRRQAALALGEIGPSAKEARPELEKLRKDADPLVQKAAREALTKIAQAK